MSMMEPVVFDYSDGRTKQSFGDSTDINKILQKAAITGSISHLEKYEAQYGDFSDFDFFEAQQQLARGKEIFDALPAEVRKDFGQSPANFFEFVDDPANRGKLRSILPEIAEPGNYFPDVIRSGAQAASEAPEAAEVVEEIVSEEVTENS